VRSGEVATSARSIAEFNIKAMYESSEKIPCRKMVTEKGNDGKTN
jgi:hypothetical protein